MDTTLDYLDEFKREINADYLSTKSVISSKFFSLECMALAKNDEMNSIDIKLIFELESEVYEELYAFRDSIINDIKKVLEEEG